MRFSLLFTAFILLANTQMYADFLTSTPVGPGMIHHHEYRSAGPWHLHVLEVDLTDTLNTLETVKASNRIAGFERTSSMAGRSDYPGHQVVGAINADFYDGSGITIGAQIINGTLLKRPTYRSTFALTTDKRPLTNVVSYNGQVTKQDSLTFAITGINEERLDNALVLYNHYFSVATGTNQWGTEIRLEYLEPPLGVNAPIAAVVTVKDSSLEAGHGNMYIPSTGGAILSGHGLARDFLNDHIFVGDTLSIELNLTPDSGIIKELVGGIPRIVRNGSRSVEWEAESVSYSFAHDRHPRTAVGFSADSTRVYFFTVDGRQAGYSAGMSLYELADYMLEWGVYQGMNLDGGGSTTMVIRGSVANSPSDGGGERSVSNALMAISMAPEGPLEYLNLPWEETYSLVETQLQFSVTGSDIYYNPLPVNSDSLSWFCDPLIGTISSTGLFTAATETTQGFVTVSIGDIVDSTLVHVTDIATLSLEPDPVILEVGEIQMMTASAHDSFGHLLQVEPEAYTWLVSSEIASVSPSGEVTAENVGNGSIQASFHGISSSVPLVVGSSISVVLDDFTTTDNYSLSGTRVNLDQCAFTADNSQFVSAPTSGRLDYSLTTGGTSALYLNCTIPVSGTPESISLQVYGDNSGHWLRGEFQNATGDKFLINFTLSSPGIDWNNEWRELIIPISEATPHWGNPNASLSFPLTWKKIYLAETNDNNKDSGTIFLDDFTVNFISSPIAPSPTARPENFNLEHQFPNPFNARTRFLFTIHQPGILELRMYSVDGQEVDYIKQETYVGNLALNWEPGDLSSGVYLFRATLDRQVVSGKCLLLK